MEVIGNRLLLGGVRTASSLFVRGLSLRVVVAMRTFDMPDNDGDDGSPLLDAEDALCLFRAFGACPSLAKIDLTESIKEPLADMSEEAQLAIAKAFFT
eukprot:939478-Amphidinium_carterae.1